MSLDVMLVLFQVVVLVFAFSVHECAHAFAAMRLGDPTAYMLGRVTLNPLKHIDPWGSLVMPLVALYYHFPLLGWARPCPVTTRNFRHIRRDDVLTTLAGPASNLLLALIALVLLIGLKHVPGFGLETVVAAMTLAYSGVADTSTLPSLFPLALLLYYGILINTVLFVFNLIPIPPLDGSRILRYYLPYNVEKLYNQLGNYGIIFVFLVGGRFILPIFYRPLMGAFNTALLSL